MPVSFSTVQGILDNIIQAWVAQHARQPDLPGVHGDPHFGWQTRDQLLKSEGFGFRLIEPSQIGTGQGHQTNLVLALTTGVQGFPRMPDGGPYLAQNEVDTIIEWINDGCPDDRECSARAIEHDVSSAVEMPMRGSCPFYAQQAAA